MVNRRAARTGCLKVGRVGPLPSVARLLLYGTTRAREEAAADARRLGGLRRRKRAHPGGRLRARAALRTVDHLARARDSRSSDRWPRRTPIGRSRAVIRCGDGGSSSSRSASWERIAALEAAHRQRRGGWCPAPWTVASWAGPTCDPGPRLAKLEASRTPTEIVLAWLAEAQAYPTLPEYVASLADAPKEAWPLGRIAAQVETAVRASARGRPRRSGRRCDDPWATPCPLRARPALNVEAAPDPRLRGPALGAPHQVAGPPLAEAELAERTDLGDPEHAVSEAQDWRDWPSR